MARWLWRGVGSRSLDLLVLCVPGHMGWWRRLDVAQDTAGSVRTSGQGMTQSGVGR